MTLAHAVLLCAVLAPLALVRSALADTPPKVEVDGGTVVGVRTGALATFRGIPFAAPPVRELRWKPPQPVVPWQGELVADRFSPMCLQPLRPKNSVFYLGEEPSSEDCLYLNVWSTGSANDRRPVMVFI
jgi:para-nitrobenzyl esterase